MWVSVYVIAGYILGKFPFKVLNIVFAIILATAIIPFEVYMIPLYFQVKALGALNSAVIAPSAARAGHPWAAYR